MPAPITVFVCYKNILSRERDGKTIEQENQRATILHYILKQDKDERYDPWIDGSNLAGGMAWEREIYSQILVSDVLLVLVGPGTSKSEWVKREIALANALGISILPLGFDLNRQEMDDELKSLDIYHLQGKITQNIKLGADAALLSEISGDIEQARQRTKAQQEITLRELLARRNPPAPKAPDNQRAATFVLKCSNRSFYLHIASGDMTKVRDIDVLVNSENNYMQMARFFESRTVSSLLRRGGARVVDGKYEDTIQRELDWQLRDRGRPVQAAEVFVTSTGGTKSELATNTKARYIFHVAAVEAVDSKGIVQPFSEPYQIERCVRACLGKLAEINQLNGVVSPPDTEQRKEQEKLAASERGAVRSIIFPLFGTGQGGSTVDKVLDPMLAGMSRFLEDPDNEQVAATLTDLYLSVFREQDLDEAKRILGTTLARP